LSLPLRRSIQEVVAASPSTRPAAPPKQPLQLIPGRKRNRAYRWRWIAGILLLLFAVAVVCVRIAIERAEPILRTRVIETLATRFKSRVELASLHVSLIRGLEVSGERLQIYGPTDPNPYETGVQPLLEIKEFRFHTPLRDLFREPMHVHTVYVNGLNLNIPPKEDRQQLGNMRKRGKMSIAVDEFVALLEYIRVGDLLVADSDLDRRAVFIDQWPELLQQVTPEEGGLRHGRRVGARQLELCPGTPSEGSRPERIPNQSQLGIAEPTPLVRARRATFGNEAIQRQAQCSHCRGMQGR